MNINDISSALVAEKPLSIAVSSIISETDQDHGVRGLELIDTDAPIVTKYLSAKEDNEVLGSSAVDAAADLAVGADTIEFWATRIKGTAVKTVASIVEVGSLLVKAKAALPHGSYQKMLVTELGPSDRKWRNYTRIAKNQVLANRHNYAVLPGSVIQLTKLAKLHDEDLQEILTEVQARLDQGEKINIDSPKFWAGYCTQYAVKAVAAQAPEPPQVTLSADPGQELPPAQGSYSGDPEEAEEPTEESTEETTEETTEESTAEPTEESTEGTTEESTEEPTEEPTAEPTEESTEESTAESTEETTEENTEETNDELNAGESNLNSEEGNAQHTALSPDSSTQSNIFPIAGHTPAPLVPADLTPTELDAAKQLFDLWDANIEEAWNDCPLKARSFFLGWKLKDMETDANKERKAA